MNRSRGELVRSLAFGAFVAILAFVAAQFEIIVSNDTSSALLYVHDNSRWLFLVTLVAILLLVGLLKIVERQLEAHQFSHWLGWLSLLLDALIGGFFCVAGVLANIEWGQDLAPIFKSVGPFYEAHQPWSLRILFALALLVTIPEPLARFFGNLRNRTGIRKWRDFLESLEARYERQLSNPLIGEDVRFTLQIKPRDVVVDPMRVGTPSWTVPLFGGDATMRELRTHLYQASGRLLMLSLPGGGKSTQFYVLANALIRVLLDSDNMANMAPAPVILDLSTCPANEKPLENWLEEGLVRVYNVYRPVAADWVKQGRILPLLDTLDSLSLAKRGTCVDKINAYLVRHQSWPLVVCCREVEYRQLYAMTSSSAPPEQQDGAKPSFLARLLRWVRNLPRPEVGAPSQPDPLRLEKAVGYELLGPKDVLERLRIQQADALLDAEKGGYKLFTREEVAARGGHTSLAPREVLARLDVNIDREILDARGRGEELNRKKLLQPGTLREALKRAAELLRDAEEDNTVRDTLRTPLLLSLAMMNRSKRDVDHRPVRYAASGNKRRLEMFRGYAAAAIAHSLSQAKKEASRNDDNRVRGEVRVMEKGLGWFGDALKRAHESAGSRDTNQDDPVIFHLRDIQPGWLPTERAKKEYRRWLGAVTFFFRATLGLLPGSAIVVIITAVYAIGSGRIFQPQGDVQGAVETGAIIAGIIGAIGVSTVLGGSIDAAKNVFFPTGNSDSSTRAPRFRSGWLLVVTLVLGIGATLVLGVTQGLVVGLGSAGVSALVVGLILGVSRARPATDDPNSDFVNSVWMAGATLFRSSVIGALAGALFVGALAGGASWWLRGEGEALYLLPRATIAGALFGLGVGFFIGFGIMLDTAGAALLQHFFLRLVLARSKVVPFRLGHFLDKASFYTLLSRVGSGYTFIGSRELRNFFAAEYWETYVPSLHKLPHHHKLTETWCSRCYHRSNWLKRLLYKAVRYIMAMREDSPRLDQRMKKRGVATTGQAVP